MKTSDGVFRFEFSSFTPGLTAPSPSLPPCDPGREHCWHSSPVQHAVMYHRDELCCWCGHARCINLAPTLLAGHGAHVVAK